MYDSESPVFLWLSSAEISCPQNSQNLRTIYARETWLEDGLVYSLTVPKISYRYTVPFQRKRRLSADWKKKTNFDKNNKSPLADIIRSGAW